jgi:integrase
VAYLTGWRLPSELFTRQWRHIDFASGWLRLEPGETKNRDGRMFPLTPELRGVLER